MCAFSVYISLESREREREKESFPFFILFYLLDVIENFPKAAENSHCSFDFPTKVVRKQKTWYKKKEKKSQKKLQLSSLRLLLLPLLCSINNVYSVFPQREKRKSLQRFAYLVPACMGKNNWKSENAYAARSRVRSRGAGGGERACLHA